MNIRQVAAQLYTIRDHLKTPADIAQSLKKIRSIGFTAVQVSGMGPVGEKELVKMLDGEGLTCCATHEDSKTILDNPQKIADRMKKLNCAYTAYPFPGGIDFTSESSLKEFIGKLNASGRLLDDNGIVLTYHNHHIELGKINGKVILDLIYEQTDRRYLKGEIDTYWIQAGGGNPVSWCKKLKGRLPLLHLKDCGMNIKGSVQPVMKEIGSGNLEWPEIIEAAENSGCFWFIIEQDTNWLNNDPFESLKAGFEFVKNTLCG